MEELKGLVVEREAQLIGVYVFAKDEIYRGIPLGKIRKSEKVWAGDYVYGHITEDDQFAITSIAPRKNFLIRPKIANVDRAIVVMTIIEPEFQSYLLDNLLVIYEKEGVGIVIVFNKLDLWGEEEKKEFEFWKGVYEKAGYPVLKVSAVTGEGIEDLVNFLEGEICIFAGPSGVGKSALLSKITGVELKCGELSRKTRRGRHTSRGVKLIPFGKGSFVGDSPGFSKVEASSIVDKREIKDYFPEFYKYECRFPNCTHTNEPDCGVREAFERGEIPESRYKNYLKMVGAFTSL
ncbi:MAG: ribosome small subunit-dependent GTPase A [Thermodesulfobacteria bacterium]|nr:ribosome small subunit-dependent GTPase A [Thermodesulfobacteriota bacterium]